MFIYLLTIILYNIYVSSFNHIKIKDKLNKIDNNYQKLKIIKYTSLCIGGITLIYVLLSLLISESVNIFLNINKTLLTFIMMSISVVSVPILNLIIEYLEASNKPKVANRLYYTYYVLELTIFLIISFLSINVFKLPVYIMPALLYFPKIISLILIIVIFYLIIKNQNIEKNDNNEIKYTKELKNILKRDTHYSMIEICKYGSYYISTIVLYLVLSTRYSYDINTIEKDLVFIYLYGITIMEFIVRITLKYVEKKAKNVIIELLEIFRYLSIIAIILAITSPLICKIIFNQSNNSIYLAMLGFLAIFIGLFIKTFSHIKNKKIIYISLLVGILSKIILIVPLINSFYRMGYNLIYGDIISTIISLFLSIIINYIYLKNKFKKEKILDKILTTLYENMILCILLIILQFIIPIKTNNYIITVLIFVVYLAVSVLFFRVKKKERG